MHQRSCHVARSVFGHEAGTPFRSRTSPPDAVSSTHRENAGVRSHRAPDRPVARRENRRAATRRERAAPPSDPRGSARPPRQRISPAPEAGGSNVPLRTACPQRAPSRTCQPTEPYPFRHRIPVHIVRQEQHRKFCPSRQPPGPLSDNIEPRSDQEKMLRPPRGPAQVSERPNHEAVGHERRLGVLSSCAFYGALFSERAWVC